MKKRAKSKVSSWMTLSGSLLVMLGPFAGLTYRRAMEVRTDEQGCLEAGRFRRQLLVLIDQSDPFDQVDRERVIAASAAERLRELNQYDRVVVMTLSEDGGSTPQVWFQRCAPKSPAQGDSVTERLLSPTGAAKMKWLAFQGELDAAIRQALQKDKQDVTPLLETLLAVAKDPGLRRADEWSILIFSDMIQNSRWQNFYKSIPRISKADDLGISVDSESFKNVSVYIHQITRYQEHRRKRPYQTRDFRLQVKRFWDVLLTDQGARISWADAEIKRPRAQ